MEKLREIIEAQRKGTEDNRFKYSDQNKQINGISFLNNYTGNSKQKNRKTLIQQNNNKTNHSMIAQISEGKQVMTNSSKGSSNRLQNEAKLVSPPYIPQMTFLGTILILMCAASPPFSMQFGNQHFTQCLKRNPQ